MNLAGVHVLFVQEVVKVSKQEQAVHNVVRSLFMSPLGSVTVAAEQKAAKTVEKYLDKVDPPVAVKVWRTL